jgi:hypothetical protein
MKVKSAVLKIGFPAVLLLLLQCAGDSTSPFDGTLSVYVLDNQVGPVAGQSIAISPDGMTAQTNTHGVAVFLLPAGDHFVDAQVCCLGPGYINYHVPVAVRASDTVSVTLRACLTCE